ASSHPPNLPTTVTTVTLCRDPLRFAYAPKSNDSVNDLAPKNAGLPAFEERALREKTKEINATAPNKSSNLKLCHCREELRILQRERRAHRHGALGVGRNSLQHRGAHRPGGSALEQSHGARRQQRRALR